MCDERTEQDNQHYLANAAGGLSRRRLHQFGSTAATVAALSALLPGCASARALRSSEVTVTTPDGNADCFFTAPTRGKHPAVIIWPDVLGLRAAYRVMAERLAGQGYAVLVINPYYRAAVAPIVAAGASFQDAATRNKVLPLARQLTPATNTTDTLALVNYLDSRNEVATNRGIGTMGYCMGGPITVRAAAAAPQRIKAGASFHGGRLVTDDPASPHRLVPKTKANFLFAIAENDDDADPQAKIALRNAYAAVPLEAEIEVYAGALHGWCMPDSRVYNEAQAERAWSRLLALFENNLA